ncbi:uncharacterized protein [Apostichopus japonicus]|uniref:uncharacterized protein isoform X1 n=1 Tax=Stichopus japonicus TaxID=307972 RepID=UPI003AB766D2
MCGEYSPRSCGVSGRSKCKRAKTILICRSLICRRSVRDDDDTSCGNDMTLNSRVKDGDHEYQICGYVGYCMWRESTWQPSISTFTETVPNKDGDGNDEVKVKYSTAPK